MKIPDIRGLYIGIYNTCQFINNNLEYRYLLLLNIISSNTLVKKLIVTTNKINDEIQAILLKDLQCLTFHCLAFH